MPRRLADKSAPPDVRSVWVDDSVTGKGTYDDPISFPGGGQPGPQGPPGPAGNPAWSVGNAMAAGGSQLDLDYTPATPLKSSVANTATTIVMPVPGAAVLWRGNCSYYVGA